MKLKYFKDNDMPLRCGTDRQVDHKVTELWLQGALVKDESTGEMVAAYMPSQYPRIEYPKSKNLATVIPLPAAWDQALDGRPFVYDFGDAYLTRDDSKTSSGAEAEAMPPTVSVGWGMDGQPSRKSWRDLPPIDRGFKRRDVWRYRLERTPVSPVTVPKPEGDKLPDYSVINPMAFSTKEETHLDMAPIEEQAKAGYTNFSNDKRTLTVPALGVPVGDGVSGRVGPQVGVFVRIGHRTGQGGPTGTYFPVRPAIGVGVPVGRVVPGATYLPDQRNPVWIVHRDGTRYKVNPEMPYTTWPDGPKLRRTGPPKPSTEGVSPPDLRRMSDDGLRNLDPAKYGPRMPVDSLWCLRGRLCANCLDLYELKPHQGTKTGYCSRRCRKYADNARNRGLSGTIRPHNVPVDHWEAVGTTYGYSGMWAVA